MAATELLIIVLVAAGEGAAPATVAAASSMKQALGPGANVLVHESAEPQTDDDAVLFGDMLGASAVVEVSWYPPKRERATIHLHLTSREEWRDREVKFAPGDAESERGRTVGFAVAAMMPDAPEPKGPDPENKVITITPKLPVGPEVPIVPRPEPSPKSFAIDAALVAVAGVGGPAGSVGGEIGARARFVSTLEGRFALGARIGEIQSIGATTSTFSVSTGLAFHARASSWLRLGARADAFLARTTVTRAAFEQGTERRSRFLPGADLLLEATLHVTESTAILAALGAEMSFGTTDLVVDGTTVSTIPYLHALGQLGVLTRF